MREPGKRKSFIRTALKWVAVVFLVLCAVAAAAFLVVFRHAIYNHYVLFPRQAAAWEEIRAHRFPVPGHFHYQEFAGTCHSHSLFSHDSVMPFPDILQAAHEADVQFICMTDHCIDGKADYSLQWKGLHEGVLFVRGFEMNYGFMPWGLPDTTVLDCEADPRMLARQIHDLGGLLFFAHSEEERLWDLPELNGMEIYNIHTNMKQKKVMDFIPDYLLSRNKYPDQTMRTLFNRLTPIIEHWDQLNATRKLTGITATDAHQNVGALLEYTRDDTLLLKDTGTHKIKEWKLNGVTRWLLGLVTGGIAPGENVFRVDFDPYARSMRFARNHVLAEDLTEPGILDALKDARVFIGFDMIADSTGFFFTAQSNGATAEMGGVITMSDDLMLHIMSPYACRLTLMRDGKQVWQREDHRVDWKVDGPGKYRVEGDLHILDQWVPWVFTNPLEVK